MAAGAPATAVVAGVVALVVAGAVVLGRSMVVVGAVVADTAATIDAAVRSISLGPLSEQPAATRPTRTASITQTRRCVPSIGVSVPRSLRVRPSPGPCCGIP